MNIRILLELLIPLLGTSLGAALVFFMKDELNDNLQKALTGFASGVMVAASIWSLLIPSIEQADFVFPAIIGFWLGIALLLVLDNVTPHLHVLTNEEEGPKTSLSRLSMMILAVTLHNIPEGMAVGVVYADYISNNALITAGGALALTLGIAIQNFPEGAIISLPLKSEGLNKKQSFLFGVLSGVVEPIAAVITILATSMVLPLMPYLLAFAAGAMMYVVVEELIPEFSSGHHSHIGVIMFSLGFTLMMLLDVILG